MYIYRKLCNLLAYKISINNILHRNSITILLKVHNYGNCIRNKLNRPFQTMPRLARVFATDASKKKCATTEICITYQVQIRLINDHWNINRDFLFTNSSVTEVVFPIFIKRIKMRTFVKKEKNITKIRINIQSDTMQEYRTYFIET